MRRIRLGINTQSKINIRAVLIHVRKRRLRRLEERKHQSGRWHSHGVVNTACGVRNGACVCLWLLNVSGPSMESMDFSTLREPGDTCFDSSVVPSQFVRCTTSDMYILARMGRFVVRPAHLHG